MYDGHFKEEQFHSKESQWLLKGNVRNGTGHCSLLGGCFDACPLLITSCKCVFRLFGFFILILIGTVNITEYLLE